MPSLRKRSPRAAAVMSAVDDAVAQGDPSLLMPATSENVAAVVADPPSAIQSQAVPQQQDDDSVALRAQLAVLRSAEEQARHAVDSQARIEAAMSRDGVPAPDAAPSQAARVQYSPAEEALNAAYPALLSEPMHAHAASAAVGQLAQAGMPRGSPAYEQNLRATFETLLSQAKQAAAPRPAPVAPLMEQPAPEPERRGPPMSAPVSRSIPTSDGAPLSGKVTLTAEERSLARSMNVPEQVWAANKLRLQSLKASGFYTEEG